MATTFSTTKNLETSSVLSLPTKNIFLFVPHATKVHSVALWLNIVKKNTDGAAGYIAAKIII